MTRSVLLSATLALFDLAGEIESFDLEHDFAGLLNGLGSFLRPILSLHETMHTRAIADVPFHGAQGFWNKRDHSDLPNSLLPNVSSIIFCRSLAPGVNLPA